MLFARKYICIYVRNGKLCVQNDPIKCENSEEFQVEFIWILDIFTSNWSFAFN